MVVEVPVNPDALPPYGEMRDHIRERLSQRDLVRDPQTRKLQNSRRTIRAHIHSGVEGTEPTLTIDAAPRDTTMPFAARADSAARETLGRRAHRDARGPRDRGTSHP